VDDDIDPASEPTAEAPAARPSDRLRLEVDLLATPDTNPEPGPPPTRPGHPLRMVLVAVTVPDLSTYVRRCLWEQPGLLAIEPEPDEGLPATLRRLCPALLITEPAAVGELLPDLRLPVLLLVQETADAAEIGAARSVPMGVLVQPFNARRLLAAVASLLGPGGNVQPP
jgi:hypothetical protein